MGIQLFAVVVIIDLLLLLVLLMILFGSDFEILRSGFVGNLVGVTLIELILGGYTIYGLWGLYHVVRSLISPFLPSARPVFV